MLLPPPVFALLAASLIATTGYAAPASPVAPPPAEIPELPGEPDTHQGSEEFLRAIVENALSINQLKRDPAPEGKKIERIVVVANDVVTEEDPWPQWANVFHTTTAPDIVLHELLFKRLDAWKTDLVSESTRNLRSYLFVATATIIAAQGSQKDTVVALVVTKDLWSLRPEMAFSFVGSLLEDLELHPAEYNFAGRNKIVGGDFLLDLGSYTGGLRYTDPRFFGSRMALDTRAGLIWNRSNSDLEGGNAHFAFGEPLFSLSSEWAWSVSADFQKDVYRLFVGGSLYNPRMPTTGEPVPYVFKRRVLRPQVSITRSYGTDLKRNFSFGWRGLIKHYDLPSYGSPAPSLAAQAEFSSRVLPYTEEAGIAFARLNFFRANYKEYLDLDTFALPEDYRLGPSGSVEAAAASPAFGFSSTFLLPSISLGYLWELGEDLFKLSGSGSIRRQTDVLPASDWTDGLFSVEARNISPRFGLFRLHMAARYLRRVNDLDHEVARLGGDGALRGYPSQYLIGPNQWGLNTELRSVPIAVRTLHIGAATFLDVGDAFTNLQDVSWHASIGAGLRIGIPQLNRPVLRLDFGIPLEEVVGATPAYFVAQFGQAF